MHLNQTEPLPEPKIMQIMEILEPAPHKRTHPVHFGRDRILRTEIHSNTRCFDSQAETEELVDWIISEEKAHCKSLLDIGSGSGCIPIAIDKNTNIDQVDGWDISSRRFRLPGAMPLEMTQELCFPIRIFLPLPELVNSPNGMSLSAILHVFDGGV